MSPVKDDSVEGNDRYLFLGLLLTLLWLPLPVGSNVLWAWSFFEVVVFGLAIAWLALFALGRVRTTAAFRKAWPVLLLFALIFALTVFQLVALPPSWVSWLSPNAAEVYGHTLTKATLSLDPSGTRAAVLRTLSYGVLFALTLLLVDRSNRLRILAAVIVFSALLQSIFGLVMTLSGMELGFIAEKEHYIGIVTGTFVNPNHLASYLGMCLALAIGLLLTTPTADWRTRARNLTRTGFDLTTYLLIATVVIVIALMLSKSHLGNLAIIGGLALTGSFYALAVRRFNMKFVALFIGVILIDIIVVGSTPEADITAGGQPGVTEVYHTGVMRDTLAIVRDYPITGTGAGSFTSSYPMYDTSLVGSWQFKHAHNDYLQFGSEFGLPGLGMLASIVLLSAWQAVRTILSRQNQFMRGIACGVVIAIIALLIHSTGAFNLQIPANAATFVVILAMAWHTRWLERQTEI